jgi:quinol monooxygenase YgiN
MVIIVKRLLKDYEAWKSIVSEMDHVRAEYGSRGATVYRSKSDPNEVYLVFDWDDQKPYQAYFNRPDVQKALDATGTTEVIEVSESFSLAD